MTSYIGRKSKSLLCVAAAIAIALPSAVFAQDLMDEVIVTATKRETSAQDLPISLTALSGDVMRELNINDAQDIDAFVPNFDYESSFGKTSPNITIRGVGNIGFFSSGTSPVGIYNDGIYVGQNIATGFTVFDLERIEILRGPQGTLFG